MADTKLSALSALAVEPADADEIYINDGGVSKRITYGVLKAAFARKVGTPVDSQVGVWTGDGTIEGGTDFTWDGTKFTAEGVVFLAEQAAAEADVAGQGQWWVKSDTPNIPMFTDDAGTDFKLVTVLDTTFACGDETTALSTGTVLTHYATRAMTLTDVHAAVVTAPTGAGIIVDIHLNGTTIMTTNKINIDATEFKSSDAATQPALTTTAVAAGDKLEFIIDQVGSTVAGAGLKVTMDYQL
jgi:hypothetical protein